MQHDQLCRIGFGLCLLAPCAWPARGQIVCDSAGTRIVRFTRSAPKPTQWTVERAPIVQIGAQARGDYDQFTHVAGIVRLANGTIAVADGKSNEVRFFTPQGGFIATTPGAGEGPGQFRGLRGITSAGDTVIASGLDGLVARFSARGRLLSTIPRLPRPAGTGGLPQLVGYSSQGEGIYYAGFAFNQVSREGIVGVYGTIYKVKRDGTTIRLLDHARMTTLIGGPRGARPPAFNAGRLWAVSEKAMCTAYSDAYVISCYDLDGRQYLRIDREVLATRLNTGLRNAFLSQVAADRSPTDERRPLPPQDILFAETQPIVGHIRPSRDGTIWVEDYTVDDALIQAGTLAGPENATNWTVFSSAGAMLASVQLPRRFKPFEMGRDYVLGVAYDPDDVEIVTFFRLRPGSGEPRR